ncbi:Flowering time control protein FCA [Trema orientale]|uniref:Flowering time control protein FCA n=1 Tax=Trema orientale TaxID=63057 RepID=A0A2P5B877_TREOI|nr:Flowering time control protein FCA [Trema orientale]
MAALAMPQLIIMCLILDAKEVGIIRTEEILQVSIYVPILSLFLFVLDRLDGGGMAKLYVSHVPRTAREQDIRPVFEPHGNIVEVVILKDKLTGVQRGSCFVKYETTVEADMAIAALNNQHFFPGESLPITVKYADKPDREREHLWVPDKVFVANLNREASDKEIKEIFSPYGVVEDVYILQSRACGFVKFTHTDMALAAIRELNGSYTMRGCENSLVVRFADPKKPRMGESRSNNSCSGMAFNPYFQEPAFRPTTNLGDSMAGQNRLNAPYLGQHFSSTSQPQVVSFVANQEPSQLSQMPQQQIQNLETSSQQFHSGVPDLPKQLHLIQPSDQILEQNQQSQASGQQPPSTGSSSQEVACNPSAAVPVNTEISELPECDWSEHTCPDGHKYYYNCVTCESLWDKPKEFALFEEQSKKQKQQQNACNKLQSCSPVLSTQQLAQPQEMQNQTHLLHQNLQLQIPALSAPNDGHLFLHLITQLSPME